VIFTWKAAFSEDITGLQFELSSLHRSSELIKDVFRAQNDIQLFVKSDNKLALNNKIMKVKFKVQLGCYPFLSTALIVINKLIATRTDCSDCLVEN